MATVCYQPFCGKDSFTTQGLLSVLRHDGDSATRHHRSKSVNHRGSPPPVPSPFDVLLGRHRCVHAGGDLRRLVSLVPAVTTRPPRRSRYVIPPNAGGGLIDSEQVSYLRPQQTTDCAGKLDPLWPSNSPFFTVADFYYLFGLQRSLVETTRVARTRTYMTYGW
ncbi:hypothetical protein Bbelb_052700 [Branchiostoma belcheri]|nr:hypothetical protein Bbelb_052700 [Branchiostoma belcheri]